MNMDLNITDFVTVGFQGLRDTVDALGGVWIDVDAEEIKHINNYQMCIAENLKCSYDEVKETGYQLLDGLQATAYCRIRYIGNDFQRAQRQRDVITAIAEKAKGASVSKLNDVANGVMDNVSTSLDISEILSVTADLANYSITGSEGFPFEKYRATGTVGSKGSCVIPQDLEVNVKELHKFLFDESNYEVSDEVKEFSQKVAKDTGKYANTAADEFAAKE